MIKKEGLFMKEYKYLLVYKAIIEDIEKGYLKYNDKIPSIRQMAKRLDVSRTTVESAYLQLLVEDVYKRQIIKIVMCKECKIMKIFLS